MKTKSSYSDTDFSRINLGCGIRNFKGWLNVDVNDSADMKADLSEFPWPFPDDVADELLASHILEHFTKADGRLFLTECLRVLKPGGVLKIAVPDMDAFIEARQTGNESRVEGYTWRDLNHFMGGDERETNPWQRHKYMYTYESLAFTLEMLGFDQVRERKAENIDSNQWISFSLLMEATK
jgi:predicted SAM-dependent methyltransferase